MTSPTPLPPQSEPQLSPRQTLPTMYDLPSENPEEPGLPEFHFYQSKMLALTFRPNNWNPDMVFSACDLYLYYDSKHPNWYQRPDWFGVVGVPRLYENRDLRLSYVIWQELISPFVVVELLSPPGTYDEDLGRTVRQPGNPPTKWEIYSQILRVPYYVTFNRYTNQMQAFHLVGTHYSPAPLNQGRLLIPELGLSLGLWQGKYEGIELLWLRWMTLKEKLILLPSEEAAEARQQATEARQQAAEARQQVERLAAKLRELGIDPEQLN